GASLACQIQALIGAIAPLSADERRRRDRYPICFKLQLMPIDEDGRLLHEEITDVVGKDLSTMGIGFSHQTPLHRHRVILALNHSEVGQLAVETKICWARLSPVGLYESGGQFISTV